MIQFSQKDKRWANLTIGETNLKMSAFGCYITSIAMIDGRTPDIVLSILNKSKCFNDNGALFNYQAAKALVLYYGGRVLPPVHKVFIAETDHFAEEGFPQHFFLWLNQDNLIIDPLDGEKKINPYNIISCRLWGKYAGSAQA